MITPPAASVNTPNRLSPRQAEVVDSSSTLISVIPAKVRNLSDFTLKPKTNLAAAGLYELSLRLKAKDFDHHEISLIR
jgi:hypothetical protein